MKFDSLYLYLAGIVALSCSKNDGGTSSQENSQESYYNEQHRPQFHFSPESGWMNDPNGMVYFEGEYHLFYQYYPDSTVWGPMHWGHAVSTDLVSWEHLPIGLYPDELGYIFSGSAVVDWDNTSGFGTIEKPPLVAIFTHHFMEGEKAGKDDFQYQSIAYSNDKGRTWTKYVGNPVLPNQGVRDFRDPKVFWHESSSKWVMILAVKDRIELYGSVDLKEWGKLSDFGKNAGSHGGVWECPDLFELTDKEGNCRWVMLVSINPGGPNVGSATQYFVGQFDGNSFKNENPNDLSLWLDYGPDNYAGVTWSDIPADDGRRLFIGWMSNWHYAQIVPTEKWRSAATITRQLNLVKPLDGFRVASNPTSEIEKIRESTFELKERTLNGVETIDELAFSPAVSEIETEFNLNKEADEVGIIISNSKGERIVIGLSIVDDQFFIDRSVAGKIDFKEDFSRKAVAPRLSDTETLSLRIFVDTSSIELFADDGITVLTALTFPNEVYSKLAVYSKGGTVELTSGKVHLLKSIW